MQLESVLGENSFLIGYTEYVCDSISILCRYIFEFLAAQQLPKIQNFDCNEC